MKKLIIFLTLCASMMFSSNAFASYHCTADIDRVLVYGDGSVNIKQNVSGSYTYICNMTETWKGIDSRTCAMWTSLLRNIQTHDQKAIFYYDGSGSCGTLPTYGNAPAPFYIGSTE